MSKKAFILHGMSGSVDTSFGIKLKEDLKKLGFQIHQPTFTIGKDITLTSWFEEMDKIKNEIDNNSIFICHSLACLFIVKYCIANNIKNKLIISVAGGLCKENEVFESFKFLIPFIPTEEEIQLFNTMGNKLYNIYSNNDHIYNVMQLERYTKELKAIPIFLQNKGHFGASSGVKEIPEIIEIIKKNN